ncbi:MAG: ATP-binding cassette domain-containing protein [Rhodospirillaceae bacterium]|nr:ATP-binding cassette domain-containing protein [Rhodospirillaceae bacterium]
MNELLKRFLASPGLAAELIVASLFINLLALAQPLFVMQVLNRYVANGVDATLVTLTSGVLIALGLEFAFRQSRLHIARGVSVLPDEKTAIDGYTVLTMAKTGAVEQIPPETRREVVNGAQAIETAYNANNITTILDVPFALVFVLALYLLEPAIAYVVMAFLVSVFAAGVVGGISMQKMTAEVQQVSGVGSALVSTASREGDTIRSFNAGDYLRGAWQDHIYQIQGLRRKMTGRQGLVQSITQSANGFMGVAVITTGAILVVMGELDVGIMIGANIMAARALQPISKFSQLGASFAKARQSLDMFKNLMQAPLEATSGSALREYSGAIELRDLAFSFPSAATPIFESLNLNLSPGSVLVVCGANGTGKTTFARLVMGLLDPSRGQVLVDGLDLKQVAPEWWRRQVVYLPQEPALLNGTIAENLRINNPEIDEHELNQIVDHCGLRRFLDESAEGFDTQVVENGWRLSEGIRRRVALARGLTTKGMLVLIDEPTESLDAEGAKAVHQILGALAKAGRTIIIMSHDPNIVKGQHGVLDLNEKPTPTLHFGGHEALSPAAAPEQPPAPDSPVSEALASVPATPAEEQSEEPQEAESAGERSSEPLDPDEPLTVDNVAQRYAVINGKGGGD